MDIDADELADFLAAYADACDKAGVEPLPIDDLAALAEAMLASTVAASQVLH